MLFESFKTTTPAEPKLEPTSDKDFQSKGLFLSFAGKKPELAPPGENAFKVPKYPPA